MKALKVLKYLALCFSVSLIFACSVCAETYPEYTVDLPDGFVLAGQYGDKTEISQIIGITSKETEKYFKDNNLLFLAVNSENTSQIKLSAVKDDFSEKTVNFSYFDDKKLLSVADNFFAKVAETASSDVSVVEKGELKFLKKSEAHKDSGGDYVVTQYVTVANSKKYRLSVLTPGSGESDIADAVFSSLEIYIEKSSYEMPLYIKVLLASGIVIFSGIAAVTVITLIKKKS